MNTITYSIIGLVLFFGLGNSTIAPAFAQDSPPDPVISLSVKNEPLIEALNAITDQSGYQFELSEEWRNHPVSASINSLPLEQGLKRLLRSLNHTILWEEDNVVNIRVYGQAALKPSGGISFASPPRDDIHEEDEVSDEMEDKESFDEEDEQAQQKPEQEMPQKGGKPPLRVGKPPEPPE